MGNTDPPDPIPFLEEVRRRYDSIHDLRKSIESKANSMISVSGTLVGLFFGFGYFIVQNLGPEFVHIDIVAALLIIGISCTIIALLFSLYAYKVKKYLFVLPGGTFFDEEGEKTYTVESGKKKYTLDELRGLGSNDFRNVMIDNYVEANEKNASINSDRTEHIWFSQWMLFVGILLVPAASFIGFSSVLFPDATTNVPPVAEAGKYQNVSENSIVKLDGGASTDQEGRLKQFIWHQICGTPVMLDNNTSPSPSFKAPLIADASVVNETLGFGLIVIDEKNSASTDNVTIGIRNNDSMGQSIGVSMEESIMSEFFKPLLTVTRNDNGSGPQSNPTITCKKFKLTGPEPTTYDIPEFPFDYSIYYVRK
jgi:hypothetical protein